MTLQSPRKAGFDASTDSPGSYAQVHTPRAETASRDAVAIDLSAKTAKRHTPNQRDDQDGTDNNNNNIDDADRKTRLSPTPLPFAQLYRYATSTDKLLLALGTAMAGVNGVLFPCMALVFGDAIAAFGQAGEPVDTDAVNAAALDFLFIAIGLFVTDYGAFVLFSVTAERQVKALRDAALQHMLLMDISWFDRTDALQLSSRLTGDTIKIKNGMGQKLGDTFKYACQFFAGYAIGLSKGWDMGLLMACVMPVMAVSLGYLVRLMRSRSELSQKMYAQAGAIAEETLGSIRTVASLNGETRAIEKYDKQALLAETENIDLAKYWSAMFGLFFASVWVMYAAGLWYGGAKVARDKATPGQVFQAFFGVLLGTLSVAQIGPNIGAVAQARGAAAALFEILDTPSEIDASAVEGIVPDACAGRIDVVDVSFAYPSRLDAPVLSNYSVSIASGQTVAFVGASGSGKSTLVALLERFYDPSRGSILLDGRDIKTLNVAWLRSQIGLVSQEPVLFAATIADNIAGSEKRRGITHEQVVAAAKLANAHTFIMALPQQYDTLVGEKGIALSGGQKQRVAIARAVAREPKILVLDEATSALDAQSEREVQAALNDLMSKTQMTTLVIAHRLSTVRHADKIVVLAGGAVVEEGSHDSLVAIEDGVYRAMHSLQEARARTDADAVGRHDDAVGGGAIAAQLVREPTCSAVGSTSDAQGDGGERSQSPRASRFSLRDAMAFSRPERAYFVVGMLTAAANGFAMPLSAVLISEIVARMAEQYSAYQRTGDRTFLDTLSDDITVYGLCYAGGAVAVFLVTAIQNFCFKYMAEKLTSRLRHVHFAALCRQDIAFFDATATGALTADLATHATKVALISGDAQGRVVQAAFTFVAALAISFATGSWVLTLVMLTVFPLLMLNQVARLKQMRSGGEALSDDLAAVGAHASEALSNIRTVAALGLESLLCEKFGPLLDAPLQQGRREAQINGLAFGVGSFAMFGTYALVFWYGGVLVDKGEIDFKQLMRTLMAITMAAQGVGSAASFLGDSDHALQAGRAIVAIRDRALSIDALGASGAMPATVSGAIEFRDVAFRYPTRPHVPVLTGFCLAIRAGETVALCGPSGGGKSTVVSLLERFYDPDHGAVLLDGRDVRDLNVRWLRSQIGLVSQEPTLFIGTIAENLAFGLETAPSQEAIEAAAKTANAHAFITQFPRGYETQVGAKGEQLSGGQKQRIAIARAVLKNPAVLLLDEATSALDAASEQQVQAALDHVLALERRRRTTIVIAHRLSTIRSADKICVVSGGAIAEMGTHADLLQRNGMYARLVASASPIAP